MTQFTSTRKTVRSALLAASFSALLAGCGSMNLGGEAKTEAAAEAAPAQNQQAEQSPNTMTVAAAERKSVLVCVVQDPKQNVEALERAAANPELAPVAARMTLVEGDSVAGLRDLGFSPDVVFLDPMFPERTKSAAVKKKFQLLHHLERPCDNEAELLGAALTAHPRKVVIKRPPRGPLLAGAKPSYQVAGKAVRYDVIVPPPE